MDMRNYMMIKHVSLLLFLLCASLASFSATRYWIGNGTSTSWNNTANWSAASGGSGGASVPGSADVALFDGNGIGDCSLDATLNLSGINVGSAYTGTITQASSTITVGSGNAVFAGGTFIGGTADITVTGTFTISGTSFTSTSGTLLIRNNCTLSGGAFLHNNGRVTYQSISTGSFSITGTFGLHDLEFKSLTYGGIFNLGSTTTLTVNGTLTYSGNAYVQINTGTIEAKGDITLANSASTSGGGSATIKINGSDNQTLTGPTGANSNSRLPNIIIDKAADTLKLANCITISGSWTYTQGIIDASTGSSTVQFLGTKNISGTHALYNVIFSGGATSVYTIATGTILTVTGELKTDGVAAVTINTGTIEALGDIMVNNTYPSAAGGGTAVIKIAGAGTQNLAGSSSTLSRGRLPHILIEKGTASTLNISNCLTVMGHWTYVSGLINPGNSKVIMQGAKTISGTHALNKVIFTSATGVSNYTINDTLTVNDTLEFAGASNQSFLVGVIRSHGHIIINNSGAGGSSTATILINGTGNQTLRGYTGSSLLSRLPHVIIDKPAGTLNLENTISVIGNWKVITGTVNAGTSKVIFSGAKTISGSHTLNDVVFTSTALNTILKINDTITVTGVLELGGTTNYTYDSDNSGIILSKGDVLVSNTGAGTAGAATLVVAGNGDQVLTGSGIAGIGRLCKTIVNKPGGILYLSGITSVLTKWTHIQGTVDAGNNNSTVVFVGTAAIDIQGQPSMAFNNLTVHSGTTTLQSNCSITGNLTVNTGAFFNGGGYVASVGGNVSNYGTVSSFSPAFTGSGEQTIGSGSALTLINLNINKPGGKVTLSSPVTLSGNLTLTKGAIVTTAANLLALGNSASVTGGSDSSYISGPMKKTGNTAFIFPLGSSALSSGNYHPLSITAPSAGTDAFTAEYIASAYSNTTSLVDSLESVSDCEHWTLKQDAGTSPVKLKLGWNTNNCNVDNYSDLTVTAWDGAKWTDLGQESIENISTTRTGRLTSLLDPTVPPNTIGITIGRKKTDNSYAVLQRKLDGGYYLVVNGKLIFKFDEEYNDTDGKLNFNIYNQKHEKIIESSAIPAALQLPSAFGDNRYILNILDCSITGGGHIRSGVYTLEIINEKNEKWYLRFKHEKDDKYDCPTDIQHN